MSDRRQRVTPIRHFDVAVVGAGPAGAHCALHLARAGLEVAILEKETLPRYKTCGGGLVWRARRHLEVDISGCADAECRTAELRLAAAGLSFRIERPEPIVTMTMRSELDACLIDSARRAGAEILTSWALAAIVQRRDRLLLASSDDTIETSYLVAADGAGSTAARIAGWRRLPRAIPALESEIQVGEGALKRFGNRARFDFGAPTHGYSWVFPKRRHLSVGCLTTRPAGVNLRRELNTYLEHLGLSRPVRRDDHGFVIPVKPRPGPLARNRVLLTGDAAGLADPVTCEGISNAIHSARLAAQAIASEFDRPHRVAARYHDSVRAELLSELRAARILARFLYEHPRVRLAAFRRLGDPLCRAVVRVMMGETTYRSLLRRPDTWRQAVGRLAGVGGRDTAGNG